MIKPLVVFTNSEGPPLKLIIRKAGRVLTDVDMAGWVFALAVRQVGLSQTKFTRSGAISGVGDNTRIEFAWLATDWDTKGRFQAQLSITDNTGKPIPFDKVFQFKVIEKW